MSLILILLAIALIGVAGWGFMSVMSELSKSHPEEPADTISRRFEVDGFVWNSCAPRALRRRYVVTQACAIPAFLCLAALVWLNETRPDVRIFGTIAFCSMSFLLAGALARKVIRHGV
ncbi:MULTISPECIES: hypothetical protein [unclassified Bradyrhizobium]|uniref:hypothetical protein n=1 Tax=unclassified Bradyrhizobium TaxID=2631580 RepID=UPI0028E365F1|nr:MULTISPECIES: hypothetical protein [unclassified Bradyrhizobium]